MKKSKAAAAVTGRIVLDVARIHIAWERVEFSPPEHCPQCKAALTGNDGVGVTEVYFEKRACHGSLLSDRGDGAGGFEGGGSSEPVDGERPLRVALECGGCGAPLVASRVRVSAGPAPLETCGLTVDQLQDSIALMEPEALVILSSDPEGNKFKPFYEATATTAHVTGDCWRKDVEVDSRHPEARAAMVLWPHS